MNNSFKKEAVTRLPFFYNLYNFYNIYIFYNFPLIYPLIIQPPAAPKLMISGILEGLIPPIAYTGI